MRYATIIRNGEIIDGTGSAAYTADIAIKDGRIIKIGALKGQEADRVIDAQGKVVCPGFIDMHSHADETLLIYPRMESKIMQGITTIVGGQCGLSPAPLSKYWLAVSYESDILEELNPNIFNPVHILEIDRIKEKLKAEYNLSADWQTFGEFLNKVEKQGIAANYIALIGHGQVRTQVMGPDCQRRATEEETAKMKEYIAEAMEAGAYGVSVGLDYVPGIYADFAELLEIAKTAGKYGGIYSAHWRKTGLRVGTPKKQKKIDGIIETLEIGKQAGVQVQLAHLSVGYDVFPAKDDYMMRAAAQRTLQVIDDYLAQGVKAAFDVVPNVIAGLVKPELIAYFAGWIRLAGSIDQFIKNLRAADYRQSIIETINSGKFYEINPVISPDWDEFITIISSKNPLCTGKTIKEIAEQNEKPSVEIIFDLLCEDPDIKIFAVNKDMQKPVALEYLLHPEAVVSTDSFVFDLEGTWKKKGGKLRYIPCSNTYCGFIKYLLEYGQGKREEIIRKATGKTAEILGLKDRGFIKIGQKADLLVLDYHNLKTNENLLDPRVYPAGVDYVLVNGRIVVEEGKHKGILAGEIIRKGK